MNASPINLRVLFLHPIFWITWVISWAANTGAQLAHAPTWVLLGLTLVYTAWIPVAANLTAAHTDLGFNVSPGEFQLFGTMLTALGVVVNGLDPIFAAAGFMPAMWLLIVVAFLQALIPTMANQLHLQDDGGDSTSSTGTVVTATTTSMSGGATITGMQQSQSTQAATIT